MVAKILFFNLVLAVTLAVGEAQCGANSFSTGSGNCQCESGYSCATCTGGYCSAYFPDAWGCTSSDGVSKQFLYYSQNTVNEICVLQSDYCDAPAQTSSWSNFRPFCIDKYVGDTCIDGLSQCNSSSYSNCFPVDSQYGPQCELDDSIATAIATWIWIVVVVCVCVFIVIPIGCCFMLGAACFAGARANNRSRSVAQPQFNNPNVAPPAYNDQQQYPPQQQQQYPPQQQQQYPPQQQQQYPPQQQQQYPPQQQQQYPPQQQQQYPPQAQYPQKDAYPEATTA